MLTAVRASPAYATGWDVDPLPRELDPVDDAVTPEDEAAARQDFMILEDALRQLPAKTREIFLMSRVQGHSYGEIANRVGISQSAVEKHMLRALRHCREKLAKNR